MSKKLKQPPEEVQVPQQEPDSLLNYHRKVEDVILDDALARLTRVVLLRGRDFSRSRFPMYTGLVAQMRLAYDRRNSEQFLSTLERYLYLSSFLVPGSPMNRDRQAEMCTRIKELLTEYGMVAMGRALLAGLWG